jgi:hypothetical protein
MKDKFNPTTLAMIERYNHAARQTRRIEMFENLPPAERKDLGNTPISVSSIMWKHISLTAKTADLNMIG